MSLFTSVFTNGILSMNTEGITVGNQGMKKNKKNDVSFFKTFKNKSSMLRLKDEGKY
jgi:hypothetical protein